MAKRRLHFFSWVPDLLHQKDNYFLTPVEKLPEKIELIGNCPEVVYNQGELCSCIANAIGESIEYILIKGKKEGFAPSRLFIYYTERRMEGTIHEDAGAMIRDGIKSVNKEGA
jgi:C1A family cysteine protease